MQNEETVVKDETTRDNTSKIQHNTSTTWPNLSTKEAREAKLGLYFALFVTEIYIFLVSCRNSYYNPTCNILLNLWVPRALINVLPKCYYPRPNVRLQLMYQNVYITPLLCFNNTHYGFFGYQVELTYKIGQGVYNIEMYFKQFFTCLKRASTFITSIFRMIYRSSYSYVFSKIGVLLQRCGIITE